MVENEFQHLDHSYDLSERSKNSSSKLCQFLISPKCGFCSMMIIHNPAPYDKYLFSILSRICHFSLERHQILMRWNESKLLFCGWFVPFSVHIAKTLIGGNFWWGCAVRCIQRGLYSNNLNTATKTHFERPLTFDIDDSRILLHIEMCFCLCNLWAHHIF